MRVLIIFLCLLALDAKELSYEDFISKIQNNSKEIIMQEAMGKSLQAEGKANLAWDSPYMELSPSLVRDNGTRKYSFEAQALFMITPKMPWVSGVIEESYNIKSMKNDKTTQLQKNIIEIGAKRAYLEYIVYKEQLEILTNKADLSKNLYEIAKKRFDAHRISKIELLRFKSDYSTALNELKTQQKLVESRLRDLQILLDDKDFSGIVNFDFYFINNDFIIKDENLYSEILGLEADDYEMSAKVISRSQMDSLSFGAGYTFGANSIDFKVIIPFPFTPKASYQQQALLELKSANLRAKEISKRKIKEMAQSYLKELEAQKELISLQKSNEEDNLTLFETMQKGYEAGRISVFEYLNTKNAYLDSRIKMTQEKLNYINLLSNLEENIGESIK